MRKYIICRGGLGNQMFQYAFYVMLSHYHKCSFDHSLFNYVKMHNGFELPSIFTLRPSLDKFVTIPTIVSRLSLKFNQYPVFKGKLRFIENIQSVQAPFFVGDWQSEKWFINCREEIIKAFTFKNISSQNKLEAEKMEEVESVSIHIRRGDYIGNKVYENCATPEYYKKAIEYIKTIHPACVFWVFSNDVEWCKCNLAEQFGDNVYYVDWNTGSDSYQDMYLMSRCKHNIIANSSFSWWGAYLNQNPNKVVIAPQKWFNTDNANTYKDIVPENWIRL